MKEKRIKGFKKAALIYGAVLAGIILLALIVLALFLNDYENTRPATVAEGYVSELDSESIHELAENTVSTLNFSIMPEEDCYAYIADAVHGADVVKLRDKESDALVYLVRRGETQLGKLSIESTGKSLFGFDKLAVSSAEFDFTPLRGEDRFSLPEDWTAECSAELIVEDSAARYEILDEFYNGEVPLPNLVEYTTGGYLVKPELKMISPEGKSYDTVTEELFIDNCPKPQRQAVMDFCEEFLDAYILYASNPSRSSYGYYANLSKLMLEGSTLQKRMLYAASGLNYTASRGDELQSVDFKYLMDLGNGYYLADFCYKVDTVGLKGEVTTENNMKLVMLQNEDGEFLAAASSSY